VAARRASFQLILASLPLVAQPQEAIIGTTFIPAASRALLLLATNPYGWRFEPANSSKSDRLLTWHARHAITDN